MNIEQAPQPENNSENKEDINEYTQEIQEVLSLDEDIMAVIAQVEKIKNEAREKLQQITKTREKIQNKREEFITNDQLTDQRKKDYEKAIRIIDEKEEAVYQKFQEAEKVFVNLGNTIQKEDSDESN